MRRILALCLLAIVSVLTLAVLIPGCSTQVPPSMEQDAVYTPPASEAAQSAPERHKAGRPMKGGRYSKMKQSLVYDSGRATEYEEDVPYNTEQYDHVAEQGFLNPVNDPLSTFSIDVDTASYSNIRRFLSANTLPPSGAVRIEEMINYFRYEYEAPEGDRPFAVRSEVSRAPWAPDHDLVMIGLNGIEIPLDDVPPRNLTFLLDVSGSMNSRDKLGLVVEGMTELVNTMRAEDHVSIVVYAGASGLVLPPTSGAERGKIIHALERLSAGGSTNGGQGIELAYRVARQNFDSEGINRVILASDGDFNVGTTNRSALVSLIERERESGISLTVLGVGWGNLKDATMEQLADHGNGNYAYLDSIAEARKVLVREGGSTLVTVAKDVKIQVEFNPNRVAGYRLIGYQNRRLDDRDFNDDTKDAGEIGAGHSIVALYEIVPAGLEVNTGDVDPLRYQAPRSDAPDETTDFGDELMTVKLRYKEPTGDRSQLIEHRVSDEASDLEEASTDLRFASAVAAFGMLLQESSYSGEANWDLATDLARNALGQDRHGDRAALLPLIAAAQRLSDELDPPSQDQAMGW
jgi:Ca-activated chloride channel family protein